ncbi:MAG: hypothetical protein V7647_893 [Acidobacteriota bacterium]|jgi:hypothetical protein
MSCRLARLVCAITLAFAAPVRAQEPSSEPPAHVSYVDGGAVLERDGQPDASPENMPILAGDRLRTDSGRLEVLFADGATLHLDAGTTVDFESDDLVRLLAGRIRLSIPGPDRRVSYRVDAPAASVNIDAPGEYRISVEGAGSDPEVELEVLRGAAELVNDRGRTPLRAGQRAAARGDLAPSYASPFNSASWDAFDRWSEARRDQRLGISTQYLPDEIRPYAAAFDRDGAWRYEASYGYVWYPAVSVGWRPYRNGRWVSLRPYGWTWVGADVWDWPTHHYGRWGLSAGAWFWIPGRTWAPAWVSWAYAPGYVSWCPLGWNNRPVIQLATFSGRGYDPWRAWTAVPDRHFGRGYVRDVPGRDLRLGPSRRFVTAEAAPDIRGYAVPRSSAPIRIAGTAAGRRADSPVYTNLEPAGSRVPGGRSRTMVGAPRATPVRPGPDHSVDAADRARAVPRESVGTTNGSPYRAGTRDGSGANQSDGATNGASSRLRAGDGNASSRNGGITAPSTRSSGMIRERVPGAAAGGTAVPRADNRTPEPNGVRADQDRARVSTVNPTQPAPGARAYPAPYPQYGAQPRATPADNPVYRPMPSPSGRTTDNVRAPAPIQPGGDTRPPDRPVGYGRPGPEMRTPDHASEGGRAVPRAEPRTERPAPEARQGAGVQRAAPPPQPSGAPPPAQPAGAASSGQGHARSGGRGR